VPQCVEESEQEMLAQWKESGDFKIVDDVDIEAFRSKAEPYLREHFTDEQLKVYEAIRGTAE
jgi:hypothetical protein